MVKKVKTVKPKAKPKKQRKPKVKPSEEQKQNVNVKVLIDQSKKGRVVRESGIPRTPATIINFPSNNPVSEIRYNPEIRYLPSPTQESASMPSPPPPPAPAPAPPLGMSAPAQETQNGLAGSIYRNPNRNTNPIASVSNLPDELPDASVPDIGEVASSVGSILLSEAYPEYSEIFNIASEFSKSNIAKKGIKRVSKLAGDAWDNLSLFTQRTLPRTEVSVNLPPSTASTEYSSNIYDYLNYDSAMDNTTIPTVNDDIFSISTRSTLPARMPNTFAEQTLTEQMSPAITEPEQEEPVLGIVAGRVKQIESKIRKPKEQSEYDIWRTENKGRYTRAEQGPAWAKEKELRKKKKGI